jgi:hypothetical protein
MGASSGFDPSDTTDVGQRVNRSLATAPRAAWRRTGSWGSGTTMKLSEHVYVIPDFKVGMVSNGFDSSRPNQATSRRLRSLTSTQALGETEGLTVHVTWSLEEVGTIVKTASRHEAGHAVMRWL